jgi:two-component system chemotaxis response regulator CheY
MKKSRSLAMKKVLLVNDSKFESIIMKDMLKNMGYDVRISGEEDALNMAVKCTPDYVIANYTMKNINGEQLISLVKSKVPKAKCLLSSNNAELINKELSNEIDAKFQTPVTRFGLEVVFDSVRKKETHKMIKVSGLHFNKSKIKLHDTKSKLGT